MGIAGQPSGDTANVADVFSTFLYTGTGSNQTINNGIDLAGEGGLVWCKQRDQARDNLLFDTERSAGNYLISNQSAAQVSKADTLTSFNTNGFSVGSDSSGSMGINLNDDKQVSWTFRKKEKFFDIVTFTGNSSTQTIAHDLGGPVGMIIIKTSSHTDDWNIWHRSIPTNHLRLDTAAKRSDITGGTAPTDTHFTLNNDNGYNGSGRTYVAYVFGDDSSEDADNQMIKCGSYNTSGSGTGSANLGWEPQFIMMKRSDGGSGMFMYDTMRGLEVAGRTSTRLYANVSNDEYAGTANINITPTGFNDAGNVASNANIVYMAIRAPMMKEPEAATEVFAVDAAGSGALPAWVGGFPVDFALYRNVSSAVGTGAGTRMLGTGELFTNNNAAFAGSGAVTWDFSNGFYNSNSRSASYYSWMWKRAKGYFDVVAYTGTGSPRTLAHSLGVVPEMIVCKSRSTTGGWQTYHKTTGNTKYLYWNQNYPAQTSSSVWNNTTPTDSVFTVGNGGELNGNNIRYVAYLFASVAGISKVGSFNGSTGNVVNVECGFAPRFVLIKKHNGNGNWLLFDTVRGIVAGNDAKIQLDVTDAQNSATDYIDPYGTGFSLSLDTEINENGKSFIFYAIA